MVDVGSLKFWLTLEKNVDVENEMGGVTRTYAPFLNLWGHIEPLRGFGKNIADQTQNTITHFIHIRWIDGLTLQMRFSYKTRLFQIQGFINEKEKSRWLSCLCEEIKL